MRTQYRIIFFLFGVWLALVGIVIWAYVASADTISDPCDSSGVLSIQDLPTEWGNNEEVYIITTTVPREINYKTNYVIRGEFELYGLTFQQVMDFFHYVAELWAIDPGPSEFNVNLQMEQ